MEERRMTLRSAVPKEVRDAEKVSNENSYNNMVLAGMLYCLHTTQLCFFFLEEN